MTKNINKVLVVKGIHISFEKVDFNQDKSIMYLWIGDIIVSSFLMLEHNIKFYFKGTTLPTIYFKLEDKNNG